ncbi:MAG: glycosyltransferase family 2 protein [Bacteroidales bacterium]|nr:glycosyltransferase family 2 protein [Bacteroidales bacterium]
MEQPKIIFVMPAYNEEENIKNVVSDWYPVVEKYGMNLIVANDGSKDSTYSILLELKKQFPLLIPIDKPNSGHGATLSYLYDYAINNGADYIFQTDSDGQTLPQDFGQMYDKIRDYDFIIGNRKQRQDGFSRVFVTKVLKLVLRIIFGVKVTDANTPFRLMRTERLKEILKFIPKDFFLTNVAISAVAVKKSEKITFMPITFRTRQGGINSINIKKIIKIGIKALKELSNINKKVNNETDL